MKAFFSYLGLIVLSLNFVACGGGSSSDGATSIPSAIPTTIPSLSPTAIPEPAEALTIHMIGDSTMTEYEQSRRPQAGWGEQVSMFVTAETTVNNWARGGRSSRSFYYESGLWGSVTEALADGDYVIIQFGHNDQKSEGSYDEYGTYAFCSDGSNDGENCADIEHSYYQFLKKYVLEAREHNATPVLMTPIVRKYFSGETITNKGQHNLEDIYDGETFARGDYAAAMRAVANEYSVPLVDLTSETKAIVESYGNEAATESLYIAADSTHPQVLFATLIAKAAMEGLKAQNTLEANIVSSTSLIASPDTLSWGNRYVGVPNVKKLTVSAFDLTPLEGNVTVEAPDGFMLSDAADSASWNTGYNIAYSNGAFTEKVYVEFNAAAEQGYSGNVTFDIDGNDLGSVAVDGTGVAAGEGVESYSSWFTEGSTLTAISDGLVSPVDVIANGLEAGSTKTLAVDGQDTSVARYKVFGADLVSRSENLYLQFAVTSASQTFYVDNISAWMTTSGGSTVQADIEYSLASDFSNPIKLNDDALSFSKDTMMEMVFGVTVPVAEGDTLYVRIYPWNAAGETSTGKYLALYDVKFSGLSGE